MAKDQFWFKHQCGSQDDPRHMEMIEDLGMEGYGIYWAIIERLRGAEGYTLPINVYRYLSRVWNTNHIKVKAVVEKYGLFEVSETHFYCPVLMQNMVILKEKAVGAAKVRWSKNVPILLKTNENDNASALQEQSTSNTDAMHNDAYKRREEKIREDKNKIYNDFVSIVNKHTGKNYRGDKKSQGGFNARIKEGYTLDDLECAIASAVKTEYHKETRYEYLTPEFFTRPDKLERFRTLEQVVMPKGRIAISKIPSADAISEYERIKAIGFDKCSQEEIEWVYDFQHRDLERVSQKQYGDDMLAKRGHRVTMKQALSIR